MSNNLRSENSNSRVDRSADFIQIDMTWANDVAIELTDEQLGIAFRLIAWCFKNPNKGGIIENAKDWAPRRWAIQAFGIDSVSLSDDISSCCHWDGKNLVIDCCPSYVHDLMNKRLQGQKNGRKGNMIRWGASNVNIASPMGTPIAPPITEKEEVVCSMQYVDSSKQKVESSKQYVESSSENVESRKEYADSSREKEENRKQKVERSMQYAESSMQYEEEESREQKEEDIKAKARELMNVIYNNMKYAFYPHMPTDEIHPYIKQYYNYLPSISEARDITSNASTVRHAISLLEDYSKKKKQDNDEDLEDEDIPF